MENARPPFNLFPYPPRLFIISVKIAILEFETRGRVTEVRLKMNRLDKKDDPRQSGRRCRL